MSGHARRDDPWTSWAAANGIDVKPSQAAVLWIFSGGYALPRNREWPGGCMTLEEVVEAVNGCAPALHAPGFSDSRLRTAVSELCNAEPPRLVVTGLYARSKRGNPSRLIGRPVVGTNVQGSLL